jgi:predicted phage baseplate assembly protein
VDDTLVLKVDGAQWTKVNSLLESGNDDLHYSLRRDENGVVYVEFGDGTYGQVPRRGVNNILATYGVGGGARGNVPAFAISKPVTAIKPLALVSNEQAASGGADAEDTASAMQRGPSSGRGAGRAVTASDYEVLARNFGVGKALAQASAWNDIFLIIAPAGGGIVSDTLKEDLLAFLDTKRIMTSNVRIVDPIYAQILIDATVTVLPQFSRRLVQQQVEAAVQQLFAFDNVVFGQTVYLSKVYEVIQELTGVQGVVISTFARKDSTPSTGVPSTGTLQFTASLGEVPTWTGFDGVQSHLVMLGGVSNG